MDKDFNPNLIFTDSEEEGGVLEAEGNFLLQIPLIANAETLEISKEGTILSEINLQDIGARPCKNE